MAYWSVVFTVDTKIAVLWVYKKLKDLVYSEK